ncbi:MAG: UDP-N-acetylmuramoyl-tripeptide--D-alanyl-D-alanine ligase, partial [Planctomycetes bacterium]|nr:UDP-N-acetylmuramoyl-tripeptide--D-alanyl-D-alanine ligase [Planctomycetota bacterium]
FATGVESTAAAEAAQVNARIVVWHFHSTEALWMTLENFLVPGDNVLVKGSRGMRMERVVNQLMEWFPKS